MRFLTFLGVGHDSRTFAVIVDGGTQRFECHVFWREPDAGNLSEAVQGACMVSGTPGQVSCQLNLKDVRSWIHYVVLLLDPQVQYQKCLVAQTPPPRTKSWRAASSKVKRANSVDSFPPITSNLQGNSNSGGAMIPRMTKGDSGVRRGMLAFFETFQKQAAIS